MKVSQAAGLAHTQQQITNQNLGGSESNRHPGSEST